VAGIKHCINERGRVITLIFFVSCTNCQNIISQTEKDFTGNSFCEPSNSNIEEGGASDPLFKWFSISDIETESENLNEDICNWIKKAAEQGIYINFSTLFSKQGIN